MNRIIVDHKKLTPEILNLLVEKFPDGYGVRDIIKFTNHKGQYIEAVEVKAEEATYLVKISDQLVDSMDNFDEQDISENINENLDIKDIDLEEN